MLVLCILAIVDGRNIGAPKGVEPLAVGLILLGISVSMGLNCGYPLNPARDLGPRLFTAVAGWGMEVFRYESGQKRISDWSGVSAAAALISRMFYLPDSHCKGVFTRTV